MQLPVADCRGPGGLGPSFSISLSALTDKRVEICADGSYAPPLTSSSPPPKGIKRWRFSLVKAPTGVASGTITQLGTGGTSANLSNVWLEDADCDGQANDSCCVELNVHPTILGEYRVYCAVENSCGMQSGNTAQLNIVMK